MAKAGKGQDGQAGAVPSQGARHPARPGTQTAAQRAAKSADTFPLDPPRQAAPPPGPRPSVTVTLPEDTRSRSYEERNA